MLTSYKPNGNEESLKQKVMKLNSLNATKFNKNDVLLKDKIAQMLKGCRQEQGAEDSMCYQVRSTLENQLNWIEKHNTKVDANPNSGLVKLDNYSDVQRRLNILDQYTCNCGQENECPMYKRA